VFAQTVEDNRENDAIIAIYAVQTAYEHRFARVAAVLEPASQLMASEIEAQQLIVEAFRPILATACGLGGRVVKPRLTRIVDCGQFGELVEESLASRVLAVERHGVAPDLALFQCLGRSSAVEI
jgi:hypothetical protein